MTFFNKGPTWLKPYQDNLNSWSNAIPQDAVWGCCRSALGSCIVTAVYTKGNIFAGSKAGTIALVASLLYTTIISLTAAGIDYYGVKLNVEEWSYIPHTTSLFAIFSSYLFGRKWDMSLWRTAAATTLPYILMQPSLNNTLSTPFFITIVSPPL